MINNSQMHTEYKVYIINILTFLISFSGLELFLKIMLLCVSIIYTVYKILDIRDRRIKNKKTKDD